MTPPTISSGALAAVAANLQGLGGLQKGLKSGREFSIDRTEQRLLTEDEAFSTGLQELDQLLTGGLPRGHLVELMGRGTSGRFSCVLSLLAASTQRGEAVALVDLGDQFDPRSAESYGVDSSRLLWTRPRRIEDALSATEILLAGSFPAVILDLGLPPLPGGRGRQVWWVRLARAVRRHRNALLVSSPYSVSSGTASFLLEAHSGRPRWRGTGTTPRLLASLELQIDRSKGRHQPRPESVALHFESVAERLLYQRQERPEGPGRESPEKGHRAAASEVRGTVPAEASTAREPSDRSSPPRNPIQLPRRPRPRVGAHPHWGYRRPAILPENADRALSKVPATGSGG